MRTSTGAYLILASLSFWLSWYLMPGVGVTDTATIFALVGAHRTHVLASVVLQLMSAAMYAPAISAILAAEPAPRSLAVRVGCALLAIGAMGSAADAIFHLVAYEMTAPGIALDAVAPVMRRLQGKDLALLVPFVVAFFLGHALLVAGLRRRGPLAMLGARVLTIAPLIVIAGGPAARAHLVAGRLVVLGFLGAVAGSLAIVGISMMAGERR